MIRYAPWLFLMFSLFGCFRKKTPPKSIEPWLEQQFPGRFSVQVSNLKMLDVVAQFRGEKRALVADQADPEVQFFLNWEKGSESLGLETQTVTQAHEHAKTEVAAARDWFKALQKAGLENFSVGAAGETLTVQVFGEPSAALRDGTVATVRRALSDRQGRFPQRVFFEIMEPTAYHTEFRDIIPRGHWEAGTGWQRKNRIMSWHIESDPDATPVWEYNPESERSMRYQEDAFRQAKTWADKNLPQPFFMKPDFQYGFDPAPKKTGSKGPAIGFSFPYFDKQPDGEAEPKGYVFGIYYPEEQVFTDVRKQREF